MGKLKEISGRLQFLVLFFFVPKQIFIFIYQCPSLFTFLSQGIGKGLSDDFTTLRVL